MLNPIDQAYFAYRADEETQRGMQATNATAGAIHLELALRYSILAADVPMASTTLTSVISCSVTS